MPHLKYSPTRLNGHVSYERSHAVKSYQLFVLLAAVVAIVLSLASLIITVINVNQSENKTPHVPVAVSAASQNQYPIACLDCRKLMLKPYGTIAEDQLLNKLYMMQEDGLTNCCARNSEEMTVMLELTMRRQEVQEAPLPEFNASNFMFSPASAHKRMYPPKDRAFGRNGKPDFSNGTIQVVFREENDYLREHAREIGIARNGNGLIIRHTGLYYIYSSIQYRPDSIYKCKDFQFKTWSHYIFKTSPNNPANTGCLLKTVHTCCDECSRDDETSFTGGVFQMRAGDIITVDVSAAGLINFREDTSFLGLMMLGSGSSE